jgi:hypothetical protein
MDALIDQLPAALGVLIGSVATFLATSAMSRTQWRRQQQARWAEVQIAAYTDHAQALKIMTSLARRVVAHRGVDEVADPLSPEVGIPQISTAEELRSAKWESVLMVGDPEVIEAAQRWKQCVWRLEWFARGRLNGPNSWQQALTDAGDAKHAFYQTVRRSLSTPGGSLRRFKLAPWISANLEDQQSPSGAVLSDELPVIQPIEPERGQQAKVGHVMPN